MSWIAISSRREVSADNGSLQASVSGGVSHASVWSALCLALVANVSRFVVVGSKARWTWVISAATCCYDRW